MKNPVIPAGVRGSTAFNNVMRLLLIMCFSPSLALSYQTINFIFAINVTITNKWVNRAVVWGLVGGVGWG